MREVLSNEKHCGEVRAFVLSLLVWFESAIITAAPDRFVEGVVTVVTGTGGLRLLRRLLEPWPRQASPIGGLERQSCHQR